MSAFDIQTYKSATKEDLVPKTMVVAAGATTINPGEPVARALGAADVTAAATATPVVGTDFFAGIAASSSTQTATVAGTVQIIPIVPGELYVGTPTTAANFDTQAEYDARLGRRVVLTLASGAYTIDDTDGATNGLVVEYASVTDPAINKAKVVFSVRAGVSDLA